jgi:hypothetical protein
MAPGFLCAEAVESDWATQTLNDDGHLGAGDDRGQLYFLGDGGPDGDRENNQKDDNIPINAHFITTMNAGIKQ